MLRLNRRVHSNGDIVMGILRSMRNDCESVEIINEPNRILYDVAVIAMHVELNDNGNDRQLMLVTTPNNLIPFTH